MLALSGVQPAVKYDTLRGPSFAGGLDGGNNWAHACPPDVSAPGSGAACSQRIDTYRDSGPFLTSFQLLSAKRCRPCLNFLLH